MTHAVTLIAGLIMGAAGVTAFLPTHTPPCGSPIPGAWHKMDETKRETIYFVRVLKEES
jgi:hypothetical protein